MLPGLFSQVEYFSTKEKKTNAALSAIILCRCTYLHLEHANGTLHTRVDVEILCTPEQFHLSTPPYFCKHHSFFDILFPNKVIQS